MYTKTCIIVVGPTAVGKTDLAIELAKQFNTSIISADSRQCFQELNIGVAKPSPQQLACIKHYFINSHHVDEEVNAALFEQLSLQWASEIFSERDIAVMVGGTGLYVKAFVEGLDEIPPSSPQLRKQIISRFELEGIEWLQRTIKDQDPVFYENGEILNPNRLIRALEVKTVSGRSILSFRSHQKKQRPFNILQLGLELPRENLYNNVNRRVDEMISSGLIEEARSLYPFRDLNALQTVGYAELFEYFDGKASLEKAIDLIKKNTRNYAKRQLTWFKKDGSIHWFTPAQKPAITAFVNRWLTDSIDPDQAVFGR